MIKFFKLVLAAIFAWVVFSTILIVGIFYFPQSQLLSNVINFGAKPDLFVWASSGETFFQDISIEGVPLVNGEYFNSEEAENVSDGDYFLFLLDGDPDALPQSIRDHFDVTDEEIGEVLKGSLISKTKISSGFQIGIIPVFLEKRTIALVDISDFDDRFKTSCQRDVIYEVLVPGEENESAFQACRLESE